MNVPDLPTDPTAHHIMAYAELATLIADPALRTAMSRQLWRTDPPRIRHKNELLVGVAQACVSAGHLLLAHKQPRPGPELDQFVDAHATARSTHDSPRFRQQLLVGATDTDERIQRYWRLTNKITGTATTGAAHDWLYNALERSTNPAPAPSS